MLHREAANFTQMLMLDLFPLYLFFVRYLLKYKHLIWSMKRFADYGTEPKKINLSSLQ